MDIVWIFAGKIVAYNCIVATMNNNEYLPMEVEKHQKSLGRRSCLPLYAIVNNRQVCVAVATCRQLALITLHVRARITPIGL